MQQVAEQIYGSQLASSLRPPPLHLHTRLHSFPLHCPLHLLQRRHNVGAQLSSAYAFLFHISKAYEGPSYLLVSLTQLLQILHHDYVAQALLLVPSVQLLGQIHAEGFEQGLGIAMGGDFQQFIEQYSAEDGEDDGVGFVLLLGIYFCQEGYDGLVVDLLLAIEGIDAFDEGEEELLSEVAEVQQTHENVFDIGLIFGFDSGEGAFQKGGEVFANEDPSLSAEGRSVAQEIRGWLLEEHQVYDTKGCDLELPLIASVQHLQDVGTGLRKQLPQLEVGSDQFLLKEGRVVERGQVKDAILLAEKGDLVERQLHRSKQILIYFQYITYKQLQMEEISVGARLNSTFIPKQILRKPQFKGFNTLTAKQQFQKTMGNIYIQIDPPQIKFEGYQLNKAYTACVKIINKAPVPQRVFILPPQQAVFSIRVNKKGPLPSGMFETVQIIFKTDEFKYHLGTVRVNTQTQNFVIPLYAFPFIPNIRQLFPKIIDFGSVQVKSTVSNLYPIVNPVPLQFPFAFQYVRGCDEIIIHPLSGVISAKQTINVEISYTPTSKVTSTAEVIFKIKQFDFAPILIRIIGNGREKDAPKRIMSSKLAPLNQSKQPLKTNTMVRKRTNMPRLIAKRTLPIVQSEVITINPNIVFTKRCSKLTQLQKEKDIKFAVYLGDAALTAAEVQRQVQLARETEEVRRGALREMCLSRYQGTAGQGVEVEGKIIERKELSWDDKRNNDLVGRKVALAKFVKAGSQIIVKYRFQKRLAKIKAFLKDCHSKKDVQKKVQISHALSLQSQSAEKEQVLGELEFNTKSIIPFHFQLQFNEEIRNIDVTFPTTAKTSFDDLEQMPIISANFNEVYKFSEFTIGGDVWHHSRTTNDKRISFQQEHGVKTGSLPQYHCQKASSVYQKALKIAQHHFICPNSSIRKYENYNPTDEKDFCSFLHLPNSPIHDEFEGWIEGDPQILKAKFMRNPGCEYLLFNGFNYSNRKDPIQSFVPAPLAQPALEDLLNEGDSDEEAIVVPSHQGINSILNKIQTGDSKDRRAKQEFRNHQLGLRKTIDQNIAAIKMKSLSQTVGVIMQMNRFVDSNQNRIIY